MECKKYQILARNYEDHEWQTEDWEDEYEIAEDIFVKRKSQYDYVEFICRV